MSDCQARTRDGMPCLNAAIYSALTADGEMVLCGRHVRSGAVAATILATEPLFEPDGGAKSVRGFEDGKPVSLYRFRDAAGALLYVGLTGVGKRRFRKHADDKAWWHRVSRIDVEHLPGPAEAVEAEARAIRTERPEFNRQEWRFEVEPHEVSVEQVAEAWSVSVAMIRRLIRDGVLPARTEIRGKSVQYALEPRWLTDTPESLKREGVLEGGCA